MKASPPWRWGYMPDPLEALLLAGHGVDGLRALLRVRVDDRLGHLEGVAGQLQLLDRVELADVAVGADERESRGRDAAELHPVGVVEVAWHLDVQPALGLVETGPAAGPGVLALGHRTRRRSAADRAVALCDTAGAPGRSWSARYDAMSSFGPGGERIDLDQPECVVPARRSAPRPGWGRPTRLREVSQARLPCTARRRGATLRNWQHCSLPHGWAAASGPGLVTVRFRS